MQEAKGRGLYCAEAEAHPEEKAEGGDQTPLLALISYSARSKSWCSATTFIRTCFSSTKNGPSYLLLGPHRPCAVGS
jgi:hypothetical protein